MNLAQKQVTLEIMEYHYKDRVFCLHHYKWCLKVKIPEQLTHILFTLAVLTSGKIMYIAHNFLWLSLIHVNWSRYMYFVIVLCSVMFQCLFPQTNAIQLQHDLKVTSIIKCHIVRTTSIIRPLWYYIQFSVLPVILISISFSMTLNIYQNHHSKRTRIGFSTIKLILVIMFWVKS